MEENRTDTPQMTEAQQQVNAFDTEALNQFGATESSDNNNLTVEDAFLNQRNKKLKKLLRLSKLLQLRKHLHRMLRTMNVVTNIGNHKQLKEKMSYKR